MYRRDGSSSFAVGQEVSARHRGGTPSGVVKSGTVEEYWFSHGCYLSPKRKSDECWDPVGF